MASSETLRQRRGGASSRGGTRREYNDDQSSGGADEGKDDDDEEEEEEEEEDEEHYLSIGPLSMYYPDALVRAVMAQQPSMEISFIEAEQALLYVDGDVEGATQHVRKHRAERARRRAKGGQDSFGHRELFEQAAAAASAGKSGPTNTGQQMMRWITSFASSAVLVLVVISLLIVAMVDGVIEVPQMVKDVARDIADSRRRP